MSKYFSRDIQVPEAHGCKKVINNYGTYKKIENHQEKSTVINNFEPKKEISLKLVKQYFPFSKKYLKFIFFILIALSVCYTGYNVGYQSGITSGDLNGYTRGNIFGITEGNDTGLKLGNSTGFNDGYNSGYSQGYNSGNFDGIRMGYNVGYIDGEKLGYPSGYTSGQSNGYTTGYTTGISNGNNEGNLAGNKAGVISGNSTGYTQGFQVGQEITGFSIKNPTYQEAMNFVSTEKAYQNTYTIYFTCFDFSATFKKDAFNAGYRAYLVYIDFDDSSNHAIVAFQTTDKGTIFFEPQFYAKIVKLEVGKNYSQENGFEDPTPTLVTSYYLIP